MLLGLEAVTMHTLLLQCPDHTLDQAVLLRAVRRDELLLQAIVSDQAGVMAAGEDQAIIGAKQERRLDASQAAVASNQRLFQGRCSRRGLAASRELPAKQFPAVAVDHERERQPAVPAAPDPAQIRGPALVRRCRYRGQRLDPWPMANRSLADLPAFDLEDPLHGVLVHPQQSRHSPIAKRGLLLDQGLDRCGQLWPHLRGRLGRPVIHRPTRHLEPAAQLADRDRKSICLQSLLDREDQLSSLPNRDANFFRARSSSMASPYASCRSLSWRSYCSRTSSGRALSAFSMPRLPSSIQLSISEGVKSNCRLASAMVVFPWMISSTSADFRRAVQRLISSSITTLIGVSPVRLHLSRKLLGHYRNAASRRAPSPRR